MRYKRNFVFDTIANVITAYKIDNKNVAMMLMIMLSTKKYSVTPEIVQYIKYNLTIAPIS